MSKGEARSVQPEVVDLIGSVASGDGEGAKFTTLEWVRDSFEDAFGFVPAPGTFNVQLTSADWAEVLRGAHGDFVRRLDPPPGFCVAHCYQVTVGGQVDGVLVVPEVAEYPLDKAEIVAPMSIRRALDLQDGDAVRLSIKLR
jgi:riboflavin kinase, archaea type